MTDPRITPTPVPDPITAQQQAEWEAEIDRIKGSDTESRKRRLGQYLRGFNGAYCWTRCTPAGDLDAILAALASAPAGGEAVAFVRRVSEMVGDELDAHASTELRDAARAIILATVDKATPKPDDSGYLTQLHDDVKAARPAQMDSWLAMDAVIAALTSPRAAAGKQSREWWTLEWIAAPRPPVHMKPMRGSQDFDTAEAALAFWHGKPDDSTYVGLTKHVKTSTLQAPPAKVQPNTLALVIAAREFWDMHNDMSPESKALDTALEPFAATVPYANEPAVDATTPD